MSENYYARVPATIRQDSRITDFDMRVFVELSAYCNSSNECWYTNGRIAENLNRHRKSVSRSISRLEEFGHICIGERRPGQRKISIVCVNPTVDSGNPAVDSGNPTEDVGQPYGGGGVNPTVDQKNSKLKNKKPPISPKGEDVATTTSVREVIDHLNQIVGGRFRMTSGNVSCIKARLNDGFTVEDCKDVVNGQAAAWLNDKKMRPFLRPATLFLPSKFEGYLTDATRNKPVSRQKVTWLSPEVWQDENGTNHTGPPPPGAPQPPDGQGMRMAAGQEGDQWFF